MLHLKKKKTEGHGGDLNPTLAAIFPPEADHAGSVGTRSSVLIPQIVSFIKFQKLQQNQLNSHNNK